MATDDRRARKFHFSDTIYGLCNHLSSYAKAHANQYDSPLSEDHFLGPAWLDMLKGLRTLLNGETGVINCGEMDAILVAMAKEAGFKEEDL